MRQLFILFALIFVQSANALDMGLAFGYRGNDASAVSSSNSVSGDGGLILGATAYLPLANSIELRTGFLYNQRYYTLKNGAFDSEVKLSYVDIPLTLLFKPADYGGAFIGAALGMKASDSCNGGDCQDAESFIVPIQLGGFFKVGPQIGVEVFYEILSGKIYQDIEDTTAVGASLIVTLE